MPIKSVAHVCIKSTDLDATTAFYCGALGMTRVFEATQGGLRGATVHLAPACIMSCVAPPVVPGVGDLSWLPAWGVRALQAIGERLVLDRWIAPGLNRFRASLATYYFVADPDAAANAHGVVWMK